LVASLVPPGEWQRLFPNPTVADAVLDRLLHNAVRISMRAFRLVGFDGLHSNRAELSPASSTRVSHGCTCSW
jgi:hypothetical protein